MVRKSTQNDGFTLIELMIVFAIIGVLVSIAVPNFIGYQARARRSEAFVNLAALARSQQSYLAEEGNYFAAGSFPDPALQGGFGATAMTWTPTAKAAYAGLGWQPEGRVFFAYDVNTGATGACVCTLCFTATAVGDVDANGAFSAIMYVYPQTDNNGVVLPAGECTSGLFGGLFAPVDPTTNQPIYKAVAVQNLMDRY
jgi:type IV pilus assembly protein PilA